jgi:hypothetical protein
MLGEAVNFVRINRKGGETCDPDGKSNPGHLKPGRPRVGFARMHMPNRPGASGCIRALECIAQRFAPKHDIALHCDD